MKWFWRIFLSLLALSLIGVILVAIINRYVRSKTAEKLKTSITEIPVEDPPRIAIVLAHGFGTMARLQTRSMTV